MDRKNVVMLANSDTALNGFLIIARVLCQDERFRPVILCEGDLRVKELTARNAVDPGLVEFVQLPECRTRRIKKRSAIDKALNAISHVFTDWFFWQPVMIVRQVRENQRYLRHMSAYLDKYRPDCLITYTDRRNGYEQAAVRIGKKRGISIVFPPVSHVYFQQFFNNANNGRHFDAGKRLPLIYRITRKINKNWAAETDGEIVFFYHAYKLLADYFLKMSNLNPWMLGERRPAVNAVSYLDQYYETKDIIGKEYTQNSLVYTTNVEEGLVKSSAGRRKELRDQLRAKYHIQGDVLMIFSAVPYYEAGVTSLEYNKEVHRRIVSLLAGQDAQILISLHPKMKESDYSFLAESDNVVIVDEALRDILCCADIFVSMEKSATNQWSELLNLKRVLLPEQWFQEKGMETIGTFFDEFEQKIENPVPKSNKPEKIDFFEILFSVLNGDGKYKNRIRQQYVTMDTGSKSYFNDEGRN